MTGILKPYTKTIKKMLLRYDGDLSSAFNDRNIEEIWQDHDNWNGGIDTYLVKINLPLTVYYKFKDSNRIEDAESTILALYKDIMKGNASVKLSEVVISPNDDSQIDFGLSTNDSMWKPGYFRLFISHVCKHKESASNLKACLSVYGIDCFVAHEDITPSKEWEVEIENGLFTMDALCAIVVPEFSESNWCDQEVGIALGQHKLVVSVNKGKNPYGFFGKFQALKSQSTASNMALEIWKVISSNERIKDVYSEKLVNLLLNVKNKVECESLLHIVETYENINKQYIEIFHSHFSDNPLLMNTQNLNVGNQIFEKYGMNAITAIRKQYNYPEDDLPF